MQLSPVHSMLLCISCIATWHLCERLGPCRALCSGVMAVHLHAARMAARMAALSAQAAARSRVRRTRHRAGHRLCIIPPSQYSQQHAVHQPHEHPRRGRHADLPGAGPASTPTTSSLQPPLVTRERQSLGLAGARRHAPQGQAVRQLRHLHRPGALHPGCACQVRSRLNSLSFPHLPFLPPAPPFVSLSSPSFTFCLPPFTSCPSCPPPSCQQPACRHLPVCRSPKQGDDTGQQPAVSRDCSTLCNGDIVAVMTNTRGQCWEPVGHL